MQQREELTVIIRRLGGDVNEENFTHLIAKTARRYEKFMIAMARGNFILCKEFLCESEERGRFLHEAEYEFGNPAFLQPLRERYNVQDSLFQSPYKWRQLIKVQRVDEFTDGAFTGKTFIIEAGEKTARMCNVVKAGGGDIIEIDLKFPLNMSVMKYLMVDFCLFDENNVSKRNKEILTMCKKVVDRPSFISKFLTR